MDQLAQAVAPERQGIGATTSARQRQRQLLRTGGDQGYRTARSGSEQRRQARRIRVSNCNTHTLARLGQDHGLLGISKALRERELPAGRDMADTPAINGHLLGAAKSLALRRLIGEHGSGPSALRNLL